MTKQQNNLEFLPIFKHKNGSLVLSEQQAFSVQMMLVVLLRVHAGDSSLIPRTVHEMCNRNAARTFDAALVIKDLIDSFNQATDKLADPNETN